MKRTLLAWMLLTASAFADEGMWTLDNFPSQTVQDRYGVEIDDTWLDRVQRATVRVEGGCTGSFVSPQGLVLTNHHCVARCLAQMSTAENDVEAHGFFATEMADEVRCEAEQLSVLVRVDEITDAVAEATQGLDEIRANEIRKQTLTGLEQECKDGSADHPVTSPAVRELHQGLEESAAGAARRLPDHAEARGRTNAARSHRREP